MFSSMKALGIAALALLLCASAFAEERVVNLPRDEVRQLVEVFDLIKHDYVNTVDDKKLLTEAIAGMVASLDSHSQYLGKEDMQDLDTSNSGNYVGIGVEVEIDGNDIRVIAPIENSLADRAGIHAGDIIVGVDDTMLNGTKPHDLSKLIPGAPDTPVAIAIARPGEKSVRIFHLKREALHGDTVKASVVAPGTAWIRISHFQATTAAELAARLNDIGAHGNLKGLVLDLRNNPGGLVSAAVGVAAAFLPEDAIVFKTRGRASGVDSVVSVNPRFYRVPSEPDPLAALPAWSKTMPMTVLVNGASASAAEIVAGALQDHKRGVVVGTPTFGKGSIQGVIRLSDSTGIKLTIARYYTPEGHSIQAKGITPDITVPAVVSAVDSNALPEFMAREIDLPHHLPAESEIAGSAANTAHPINNAEKTSSFGTASDKALNIAIANLEKTVTAEN
jgi:carboxyl-terminal processing protease